MEIFDNENDVDSHSLVSGFNHSDKSALSNHNHVKQEKAYLQHRIKSQTYFSGLPVVEN